MITRIASERILDDFDPNTVLNIMSMLVQYNKLHSRVSRKRVQYTSLNNCAQEILEHIEALLRVVLTKFAVGSASLARLLQTTSIIYRRQGERENSRYLGNAITLILIEICSDALRSKIRISPYTLKNMIEVI